MGALGCGGADYSGIALSMGVLTEVFEASGVRPIIAGGLAVELYTQSEHTANPLYR